MKKIKIILRDIQYIYIYNMRKCNFRRCNKEISGRKDKQYCNRSCKRMEQTYRKREKIKNEKLQKMS